MVLVHCHRKMREALDCGLDQVLQEDLACVFTGAGRRLHDDGGIDLVCRLHDRLHLLEVVDVERRHSVAIFGRVIQQLTHRHQRHCILLRLLTADSMRGGTRDQASALRTADRSKSRFGRHVGARISRAAGLHPRSQACSPTRTIFNVLVPPACPIGSPTVITIRSPRLTTPLSSSMRSALASAASRSATAVKCSGLTLR